MSFFEKQPALSNVYSVKFKDILKQLKGFILLVLFQWTLLKHAF